MSLKMPVKKDYDMADLEVKYLWEPVADYLVFYRIIFVFFLDTYLICLYIIL